MFTEERTTGTLEKLLSTPIRRWELVLGYVTGFGALTVIQSLLITYFILFVLDVMLAGSVVLVLATTLLTAICALTLGMLLSTAANSGSAGHLPVRRLLFLEPEGSRVSGAS